MPRPATRDPEKTVTPTAALTAAARERLVNPARNHQARQGNGRPPLPHETVLLLVESLGLTSDCRVLVVGMADGFLVAVLARLAGQVAAVEPSRAVVAALRSELDGLGATNVVTRADARLRGWEERAPFDGILVHPSARKSLQELRQQLARGGRLLTFTGSGRGSQDLVRVTRLGERDFEEETLHPVRLVATLGEIVSDLGLLSRADVDRALEECGGEPHLAAHLQDRGLLQESDVYLALAEQHGYGFVPVEKLIDGIDLEIARSMPRAYLQHQGLLPLKATGGQVTVAVKNPHLDLADVAQAFQAPLAVYLVTPTDYRRLWMTIDLLMAGEDARAEEPEEEAAPPVEVAEAPGADSDDLLDGTSHSTEQQAQMLFDAILLDAIGRRASDVHLECGRTQARLRLRVDGCLQPYDRPVTNGELRRLINVFKVRAGMDISEHRLPQGGGIRLRVGRSQYDLRIQTQPSLLGENAVVRILAHDVRIQTIEELGFPGVVSRRYRRLLANPSGMVLVVGPTGSGKSTTLYSGLGLVAGDGTRKVVTIEDPIEYSITGVQQSQVQPAIQFGFAGAVRSFLRQDPDVILVGEIRDRETARETVRASQTGHLVLSTLHCNETTDAIQRLVELGCEPNSIAGELLAVFSQRLARRICTSCREPAEPEPDVLEELFPDGPPAEMTCFRGRGCSRCGGTGTRGRIAVLEYMELDDELRRVVARGANADEVRHRALDQGLMPLRDRALELVAAGEAPLADLVRFLSVDRMAPERPAAPGT